MRAFDADINKFQIKGLDTLEITLGVSSKDVNIEELKEMKETGVSVQLISKQVNLFENTTKDEVVDGQTELIEEDN